MGRLVDGVPRGGYKGTMEGQNGRGHNRDVTMPTGTSPIAPLSVIPKGVFQRRPGEYMEVLCAAVIVSVKAKSIIPFEWRDGKF